MRFKTLIKHSITLWPGLFLHAIIGVNESKHPERRNRENHHRSRKTGCPSGVRGGPHAVGVMLKNAWLQALLMRPAKMKESPGVYFRPAVFICDEYQAFASVGEDDPSGDEKSFALTRQCRCIPIVATQSISSLRAVLGSSEAWRALLQTLRTRIFLSLSDDASAQIASELCGQVVKIT